ncbi:hypothetical protein N7486_005483 [Penicillium sp. IBT 16267x]|nr:hypothetical protein N7486_005483 [Penicillium sp. IBT 16267x]
MRQVILDDTLVQQMITSGGLQNAGSKAAKNSPTARVKSTQKATGSSWTYAKKPSIAAATIIAAITFFAIIFLLILYLKRRRDRRSRHHLDVENQPEDPFNESSLTLTEDTSKKLDQFLLRDIQPERTSLMFSRSRSPSFTFVVDENDQRNPASRLYRGSYDASSMSLRKLDSLTRVSTDGSQPSMGLSDLTPRTSKGSGSGSGSGSSSISTQIPAHVSASRLSRASTGAPTVRSSMWSTTSVSTRSSTGSDIIQRDPVYCRDSARARSVVSLPRRESSTISPARSLVRSNPSNASRPPSRISLSSPRYSAARVIELVEDSQRENAKSHRGSISTHESPVDSWSASGRASQLPSILSVSSTQSLFRFSEG